jgi:ATP-dependent Lhr-like helicase
MERSDISGVHHWPLFFERLVQAGRACLVDLNGAPCWAATERLAYVAALREGEADQATGLVTKEAAVKHVVQGWMQITGPITAASFAAFLQIAPAAVFQAFLAMEMQGLLMRGVFERPIPAVQDSAASHASEKRLENVTNSDHHIEWCERRILQRIHRLTLATARKQIEPVPPSVYMRWLLGWQHLAPQMQLSGEEGVLAALHQLEGFEAPAVEWERTLLPARVANYDPRWLDQLCLSGAVGWGRISPHPAWAEGDGSAPRRVVPTNAAPITFYIRETADWLPHALAQESVDERLLAEALSPDALRIRALLAQCGACFTADLQRMTGLTRQLTAHALWELATAGLASADGFDQLRALMDPRRKANAPETDAKRAGRKAAGRTTAGRWSLLNERPEQHSDRIAAARQTDRAMESFARMLLARYGVLFRDLLARESNAPKWRELLGILRRLEARGDVRGGRFVTGFGGEQYALPEAVDSLRAARAREMPEEIAVAAADPLNLIGIVVPGERVPAVPGKEARYLNGSSAEPAAEVCAAGKPQSTLAPTSQNRAVAAAARRGIVPAKALRVPADSVPSAPTLF